MRVYFVGASGTGKSTLKNAVAARYSLPSLPSAARDTAVEMGVTDWALLLRDRERYAEFQLKAALRQIAYERQHDRGFVADRSLFDQLAYTAVYGTNVRQILAEPDVRTHLREFTGPGHVVFLCSPVGEIREAALRQGGRSEFLVWEDMLRIDGVIRHLTSEHGVRYTVVGVGTHIERMNVVDAAIDLHWSEGWR